MDIFREDQAFHKIVVLLSICKKVNVIKQGVSNAMVGCIRPQKPMPESVPVNASS